MANTHGSQNIHPALLAQADQLEAAQAEFADSVDAMVVAISAELVADGCTVVESDGAEPKGLQFLP